jgi:DNA-binding NarL/FixJ family response regulator
VGFYAVIHDTFSGEIVMIRVAIVEDDKHIREGLADLISGTQGFRCAMTFPSMEQALALIDRDPPDILLVDIGLPGMSGIEGIRRLKQKFPKILFLVLTVYEDDDRIFDALCAGACGYLLKKTPSDHLLESIRDAMQGGSPISPEVAHHVIQLFQKLQPDKDLERLTPYEMRVLKLLADGNSYDSAAQDLGISVNTIRFHIRNIYDKLHVHSKSEAVAKALRNRLIQ